MERITISAAREPISKPGSSMDVKDVSGISPTMWPVMLNTLISSGIRSSFIYNDRGIASLSGFFLDTGSDLRKNGE